MLPDAVDNEMAPSADMWQRRTQPRPSYASDLMR